MRQSCCTDCRSTEECCCLIVPLNVHVQSHVRLVVRPSSPGSTYWIKMLLIQNHGTSERLDLLVTLMNGGPPMQADSVEIWS